MRCLTTGTAFIRNVDDWLKKSSLINIRHNMKEKIVQSESTFQFILNMREDIFEKVCYGVPSPSKRNIGYKGSILHYGMIEQPENIYHKNHLVDGVKNSNISLGGCVKSKKLMSSNSIWLSIDLKLEVTVRRVIIYLSNNYGLQHFLINFLIIYLSLFLLFPSLGELMKDVEFTIYTVQTKKDDTRELPYITNDDKICAKDVRITGLNQILDITCYEKLFQARYVILEFKANLLEICEVEVYSSLSFNCFNKFSFNVFYYVIVR